jgi:hypothetical protein
MKILKEIASGCRRLLRLAAETQLGPLGINLQQKSLTSFFKVIKEPLKTPLTTRDDTLTSNKRNTKRNRDKNISFLNMNLLPTDIFHSTHVIDSDVTYWEFKAG